jgi:hypothetical protein
MPFSQARLTPLQGIRNVEDRHVLLSKLAASEVDWKEFRNLCTEFKVYSRHLFLFVLLFTMFAYQVLLLIRLAFISISGMGSWPEVSTEYKDLVSSKVLQSYIGAFASMNAAILARGDRHPPTKDDVVIPQRFRMWVTNLVEGYVSFMF